MNQKAMTLIEIVVSMIIMAVAALAVTSTMTLVSGSKMRSVGGSSLDLQAASYARQTLEALKNNVSTNSTTNIGLIDDSYGLTCDTALHPEGDPCGAGKTYTLSPSSSDLFTKGNGTRTYTVWDISNGNSAMNNGVAYKKVTVAVRWND